MATIVVKDESKLKMHSAIKAGFDNMYVDLRNTFHDGTQSGLPKAKELALESMKSSLNSDAEYKKTTPGQIIEKHIVKLQQIATKNDLGFNYSTELNKYLAQRELSPEIF